MSAVGAHSLAGVILRAAEVREVERQYANLQPALMERAGQAAAERAQALLVDKQGCVLVLAGPGNNGGDGFVVARLLRAAGCDVVMVCAADETRMPADARAARLAWQAAGGQTVTDFLGGQWGLAIDALFGIGLTRPLEGRYADWIARLNALSCPVLSLDVPSGIDSDSGRVMGVAVRATHTSSFIALKPGLLTLDGPDHCGELALHALDLPPSSAEGRVLERAHFAQGLRPRAANSHKGSYGQAGVIGGAAGMLGAALLAARACLYGGAGRVYVGLLDLQAPTVDGMQPELMLRPPGDLHLLCNALALGPGMGQSEVAGQQLRRALGFSGPLVLDADALNLVASTPTLQTMLTQRESPTLLTPHPAEAARLMQCALAEVQSDRVTMCCALARRYRAHVLLKGAGSIVAFPDGRWFINLTGNAGLASAGSGDVLTGLLTALLAQGWSAEAALLGAVHLHGAAADELVSHGVGPVGLTAGELAPAARRLLNQWVAAEQARSRGTSFSSHD
ncbi:NAD(P)H-hydrate dehydratase [Uliginosibacterium sp. H3]|uniref:Bifunctional NAD(P)H-hydrate repair enzyme n=1 Tax=Uliginosibacterium silvisoli TaxID=3114758 RepID=A0ABU6K5D3_9RHOO|nr:NAD(P)H-hydrate dehydratase [Uliginosibacterium sp. H3]